MVTTQNMSESEMGNRVSKSDGNTSVKEQRVDGSGHVLDMIKVYSNGLRNGGITLTSVLSQLFSTVSSSFTGLMNPWFVTGFTDAEGCFNVKITKANNKLGWRVNVSFLIVLHLKDKALLEAIQVFFGGVGTISVYKNTVRYDVSSVSDLYNVIIPHFEQYMLCTQKQADFLLFKQVVSLMHAKLHLTVSGLLAIHGLRANLNRGADITNIPGCVPVARPDVVLPTELQPHWIAGFTSGDGGFFCKVSESDSHKLGARVVLSYEVAQDIRDYDLMTMLIAFFGCGTVYVSGSNIKFRVQNFENLYNIILPFFEQYPIWGIKAFNFGDWCTIAHLMRNKKHLTSEGLDNIRAIISNMNSKRTSV